MRRIFPGGLDTAKEIERDVMLQILDQRWRDHLSDMDYLRDGIHLRQIAQQDPLNAWQKEGYLMFEHLLDAVDSDYVRYITHVEATAVESRSKRPTGSTTASKGALTNANVSRARARPSRTAPKTTRRRRRPPGAPGAPGAHEKPGRNDPCWCGSKRKYKQCHGRP